MLEDKPVLIVQDIYLALDLSAAVEQLEGRVVGPVSTVADALAVLDSQHLAAAIVDCELPDGDVRSLINALSQKGVPFVVQASNAASPDIVTLRSEVPVLRKPVQARDVVSVLAHEVDRALLREIERLRGELARTEAQLAEVDRLAHRDQLVDLPNRRSFINAIEHILPQVQDYGAEAAVLFADVDGLKPINDQFGHRAGDRVLIKVAQVLVETVRKHDIVGRLGGDEFGVLLKEADELSAWRMALRVAEAVGQSTLQVGDRVLPLSVAIGAATIEKGDTPEVVLSRADKVMYRFKAIGGSRLAGLITSVDRSLSN